MRSARWSVPNAMLAGVLALALCSGGTVFGGGVFSRAWADEAEEAQRAVDDAQATLDDAEAHMESIAGDYDALKQDVEELQARVDEISAQAMDPSRRSSKAARLSARRRCTSTSTGERRSRS